MSIRCFLSPLARCLPILGILLTASVASAQVNTSGIRGKVVDEAGNPVEGAEVSLLHEPSGNEKTATTNASGAYVFTGLRVGGPYAVTVFAEGYEPQGMMEIYLAAGKPQNVPVALVAASEVIEISGKAVERHASGRSVFGASDINNLPSIGRDPKDLVRISANAYTEGGGDALSIGGANNRFNSVTIDGIRQDDDFGLNANGYPTQRSPVSLTAVEQISVETTPFDVRYGKFLGGNVNIVTKSGTNEFKGSILGTFANQGLTGKKSGEERLDVDFREIQYAGSLGGPIIKDKLHFFVSVEGLDATTPTSVGPAGSGATNEVLMVTQQDVDQVRQIAQEVYGFDPGVASRSLDEFDIKVLSKVDWAITDKHRLTGTYQRTSGNNIRDSFSSDRVLTLTSNWYERNDTLNSFSARFFSDWTERLSTELEFSGKLVDTAQDPLNGNEFMTAEIQTEDGGTIILGPDPFRHNNELQNNLLRWKAQANYLAGDHLFTAGWEFDKLSINNLFVPNSRGVAEYDSIEDFAMRRPSEITYGNAITNDPKDAAADWGYGIQAAYIQDQYDITTKLTAQAGLRFESYHTNSDIPENPHFVERHGFSNKHTINNKFLLMPRAGISYRPIEGLNLRGGAGLYSGGTPNVWRSNSYTNDGVRVSRTSVKDAGTIHGFNGREIPQALQDDLEAGDGDVDALDPNFKIPSTWKAAVGADYTFDIGALSDIETKVDYTYSKVRDGLQWQDLRRALGTIGGNLPVGTLPDGRPLYDFDDSDGTTFDERRGHDMLLTNTDKGYSHVVTVSLAKRFDWGANLFASYGFQNVKEVGPANSARSVSNYGLVAVANPANPGLSTSDYERKHRFTGVAQVSRPLIGDISGTDNWMFKSLKTGLSVFVESRSGRPYSYTFADDARGTNLARIFGEEREFARRNRQLFYVPSADMSEVILDGIDPEEFEKFLADKGLNKYRGQIAPRNAFTSPWFTKIDLRFSQDLPVPVRGDRARFILDFENFGNLVNPDWGRAESIPSITPAVDVNVDPATGKYIYSNLRTEDPTRVDVLRSVWRIQATLMYEF